MVKAEEVAVAMAVIGDKEYFLVGMLADVKRLYDGGFLERVWDIRLDNGHRPYPSLKKRMSYERETEPTGKASNPLTREIAAGNGLKFSADLHPVVRTYLFRKTASFWDELWVDFSGDDRLPCGREPGDYHAVYRGAVLAGVNNVKFTRL